MKFILWINSFTGTNMSFNKTFNKTESSGDTGV